MTWPFIINHLEIHHKPTHCIIVSGGGGLTVYDANQGKGTKSRARGPKKVEG